MVLRGIDISSWQANIDVSKISGDFVIVKATEGVNYVNPYCDSRYQLAKKSGKLLGVYHYAKNGNPEAEATYFFENIKGYIGEAILFLDYEEEVSANSPSWCLQFLTHLDKLTNGVKGMLYTYQSLLNSQNWQSIRDADYGLWFAAYGANLPEKGYKSLPAPTVNYWGTPAIYQYSSKTRLDGYSNDLDANIFYGDKESWTAYAKGTRTTDKFEQAPPEGAGGKVTDTRAFGNRTIVRLRKTATHWYGGEKIANTEKEKAYITTSRQEINQYGSKFVYTLSTGKKVLAHDLDYLCCIGWDTIGINI